MRKEHQMNKTIPVRLKKEPLLEAVSTECAGGFIPRTELGKRLVALRNKAIATAMRLLDEKEILEEVRRRRGEIENDEADLS